MPALDRDRASRLSSQDLLLDGLNSIVESDKSDIVGFTCTLESGLATLLAAIEERQTALRETKGGVSSVASEKLSNRGVLNA